MVGEISAALTSLKTAFDIARSLQELKREGDIEQAISGIQSALVDAKSKALNAQAREMALVDEINRLKAQIASFEAWDREKERYELYKPREGVFTYALKDRPKNDEPPMQICPNCYENRQKSILQHVKTDFRRTELLACPGCKAEFVIHGERPDYNLRRER